MLELFRNNDIDYWIKSKIVDCGKSENFNQINIDILDNNQEQEHYNDNNDNNNNNNDNDNDNDNDIYNQLCYNEYCEKLNNNYKQPKNNYNNESTYHNKNSKSTERNTRTESIYLSNNKYKLQYNRYKVKDNRIYNLQKTSEYNSIYKCTSSNSNQRQMHNVQPKCKLYYNKLCK